MTVILAAMPATGSVADASMELTVRLGFGEPQAIDDGGYTTVIIEGADQWDRGQGEPMVPSYPLTLLLPADVVSIDDVRVEYEGTSTMVGVRMTPSALTTSMDEMTLTESSTYATVGTYPGVGYELDERIHMSDGYRLAHVTLFPLEYTPLTGEASVHSGVEVTLTVTTGDAPAEASGEPPEGVMLESYASTYETTASTDKRLLLITSEGLMDDFEPFITWKESHGITVVTVTTEEIASSGAGSDTQESIRDRIIEEHAAGADYVLLGGDDEIIPHRGLYGSVNGGGTVDADIAGDLYYACLDGDWNDDGDANYGEIGEEDLYAEVAIGRAPVASASSVQTFCQKVIDYESSDPGDDALFLGESLDSKTWGGTYKDGVEPYADDLVIEKMYERDGTFMKSSVKDALNDGVHVVNNMGHGNTYIVADLFAYDATSLTNDRTFIWYSQSCYVASFDNRGTSGSSSSTDCIAERMVDQENGAVAFIGNSRYGWYYSGSTTGPSNEYDKMFFDEFADGRLLGDVFQDSKERKASSSGTYTSYRWVYYELNLLGDPTLMIGGYGTSAPEVVITSPADGAVASSTINVTWTFTGSDLAGATIAVDGGTSIDVGTAASYVLNDLTVGQHTVIVTATDLADNVASDSVTFTVDDGAPVLTITSPDDGTLTSENSVTVEWEVTDGGSIGTQVRLDDGGWVTASGTHTFSALSDGVHTASVKASDGTSEVTSSVTFTVDSTAPTVSIASPGEGDVVGDDVTVTWTGSDAMSGIAGYEADVDGGGWTSQGTSTTMTLLGQSEGAHTVTVRATDAAGNSATAVVGFTVDTMAPAVTIASPGEGSYNPSSVTVAWDAPGASGTEVCVDDGAWVDTGMEGSYDVSLTHGPHTVVVRATDALGNIGEDSVSFNVDTVSPTVTISSPADGSSVDGTVTVRWSAEDASSGVAGYELRVDSGSWDDIGTAVQRDLDGLASGTHTVSVRAIDLVGNLGEDSVTFTVGTAPSGLRIIDPQPGLRDSGTVHATWVVDGLGDVRCVVSMDDGYQIAVYDMDHWFIGLRDGDHHMVVTYEASGATLTDRVDFRVDTVAPTLLITQPAQDAQVDGDIHVVWSASDANGIAGSMISLDSGGWVDVGLSTSWTFDGPSKGSHFVTVLVTDNAGRSTEATTSFEVVSADVGIEMVSPTEGAFIGPSTVIEWTVSGATPSGYLIELDGSTIAQTTATSFVLSDLGEGEHTVRVVAVDGAGIASDPVTFITDLTAPVIDVTSPVADDVNSGGMTVEWSSHDALSGVVENLVRLDSGAWVSTGTSTTYGFDDIPTGDHTVAVKSVDAVGNERIVEVSFSVSVAEVEVTITSPDDGASIREDTVTVTWEVIVEGGPAVVEMSVDDGAWSAVLGGTRTLTGLSDGPHTISVRATSGQVTSTNRVDVTIDTTPPMIVVTSPDDGSSSGDVRLVWEADDVNGVTGMWYSVDSGSWVQMPTGGVDLHLMDGSHTIILKAVDACGNEALRTIGLVVGGSPPEVKIVYPSDGAKIYSRYINVLVSAHDDQGIESATLFIDGEVVMDMTASSRAFLPIDGGVHVIRYEVTDVEGSSAFDEVVVDVRVALMDIASHFPMVEVVSPTMGAGSPMAASPDPGFAGVSNMGEGAMVMVAVAIASMAAVMVFGFMRT